MNEIRTATFARLQHYGDGTPDPRTATCSQHEVASPYSGTAKGDGITLPEDSDWPCVVCPLPYADLIGTEVITYTMTGVYLYGGNEYGLRDGATSLRVSLRGRPTVVKCGGRYVAPADTLVDEKDTRITITKMPAKRTFHDSGLWLPSIDHPWFLGWEPRGERTRRAALATAARHLAIAEYHVVRQEKNKPANDPVVLAIIEDLKHLSTARLNEIVEKPGHSWDTVKAAQVILAGDPAPDHRPRTGLHLSHPPRLQVRAARC